MPQHRLYDSEVTVYVWRFTGVFGRTGHAAVKITGLPAGDKAYMSWWPGGEGAGLLNALGHVPASPNPSYKKDMESEMSEETQDRLRRGEFPPREGQLVIRNDLRYGDIYGQKADVEIKLPARGATPIGGGGAAPFGLDIGKMYEWWTVFRTCPHPKYKFASKYTNCAGVAAAALRVGGAGEFAKPPTAVMFLDPNQIANWARKVQERLDALNTGHAALLDEVNRAGEVELAPLNEIMNEAQWRQLSNQNMGGAFLRSEKVRDMDRLLHQYHTEGWGQETKYSKFLALNLLMNAIHYYLAHKPGSKRGDAVLTLGKQVLSVARAKAEEYTVKKHWAGWAALA